LLIAGFGACSGDPDYDDESLAAARLFTTPNFGGVGIYEGNGIDVTDLAKDIYNCRVYFDIEYTDTEMNPDDFCELYRDKLKKYIRKIRCFDGDVKYRIKDEYFDDSFKRLYCE